MFLGNIGIDHEKVPDVVLAACALHNFLRTKLPTYTNNLLDQEDPETHVVVPGAWRADSNLEDLDNLRGNTSTAEAKRQREILRDYVNGPGAVSWQDRMIIH